MQRRRRGHDRRERHGHRRRQDERPADRARAADPPAERAALTERRDLLVEAVRRHVAGASVDLVPRGGFSLWVRLPDGLDDVAVAVAAEREGVIVSPGRPWFPAEPPAPFLRLTFAAARPDDLDRGARILGRVVAAA